MKYALLKHSHGDAGIVNFGDHIQSLAAKQFLPKVDHYVERDELNADIPEKVKLILNGWFTYKPENWPPHENIEPLFVSFHLNPRFADVIFNNSNAVEYLKKHGPIGCRDYSTYNIMQKHGIDSYFSFCLTSTLDINYKTEEKTDNIYFVDVLYDFDQRYVYKADPKRVIYHIATGRIFKTMNLPKKNKILKEHVPQKVIDKAIVVNQFCSNKLSNEEKYKIADDTLRKYATAKIVVTSRIHCALPCLAMGTPVLFIFNGLEDEAGHLSRFKGTVNHLNILSTKPKSEIDALFDADMNVFSPDEIDWDNPPKNPSSYMELANALKKKVYDFIKD